MSFELLWPEQAKSIGFNSNDILMSLLTPKLLSFRSTTSEQEGKVKKKCERNRVIGPASVRGREDGGRKTGREERDRATEKARMWGGGGTFCCTTDYCHQVVIAEHTQNKLLLILILYYILQVSYMRQYTFTTHFMWCVPWHYVLFVAPISHFDENGMWHAGRIFIALNTYTHNRI